jgi:hypothetical protein
LSKKATDEREKGEVKPEGEEETEEMAEETEEQSVEIKIEKIEDKETEHERAKRRKRGNNTQRSVSRWDTGDARGVTGIWETSSVRRASHPGAY